MTKVFIYKISLYEIFNKSVNKSQTQQSPCSVQALDATFFFFLLGLTAAFAY